MKIQTTAEETGVWLRRFNPSPDPAARIICFPHAGGSATFFNPLAKALPATIDALAVQYPGRQDRRHEPLVDDVERLADLVVAALPAWPDQPVALFGHSLGATLAFEVAQRLQDGGRPPAVLFVSGRRAPSRQRAESSHLWPDDALIAELKGLSGTQASLLGDEEVVRMILPVLRNDYRAAETYRFRPRPPLRCPVVAMTGLSDPKVTLDEVRAWREHTTDDFRIVEYPGDHFYLVPQAAAVIAELTRTVEALCLSNLDH